MSQSIVIYVPGAAGSASRGEGEAMTQDNSRLPPHVYDEPDDGVGWVQCRKCREFGLLGVERYTGPCDLVYAQDVEAWLEHWHRVDVNERPSTVDVLEAIMRGEGPPR